MLLFDECEMSPGMPVDRQFENCQTGNVRVINSCHTFLRLAMSQRNSGFYPNDVGALRRAFCCVKCQLVASTLLGLGVLGDGLGALRHGVLGQLTGQQKPDSSLDFSGGDGAAPVVVGKSGGLGGNALENVIHE